MCKIKDGLYINLLNKELDGKDNDEVHDEDDNEHDMMMVKIIIIYETANDNEDSMKMMVT